MISLKTVRRLLSSYKEKSYDAALFDVQMPVMDGIAATQEIRKLEQIRVSQGFLSLQLLQELCSVIRKESCRTSSMII